MSKILLIGDSCLDIYHYGICERMSPEAPVPVFKELDVEIKHGMSLNVKRNLENFGFCVHHVTNKDSIEKHRFIELSYRQQMFRFDKGEKILLEECGDIPSLDEFSAVVISDYDKGFIRKNLIDILRKKNINNLPVFVDSKKKDLKIFHDFYLKINEKEYNNSNIKAQRNKNTIVTLGSRGAMWDNEYFPSEKVDVYDVCGAGDVFLASLVYGMIRYNSIRKSIEIANKCASFSVTKNGTYCLTKEDINDLCI